MGWGSIKKAVSKAVKQVGKETSRVAKKTESTVRHFDSTDWAVSAFGVFGAPYLVYDHNKDGIKRALGLDEDVPEGGGWTDAQNTETNEGESADKSDEERRKRLASGYSLKRTSSKTGRVLGGALGGAGAGGSSVRGTGGSV